MNNLARNIGIWYYDEEWARKLFDKIYEGMPPAAISQKYDAALAMALTDGTLIRFFGTSGVSGRGIRLTESYVQEGISYNFFYQRIYPVTEVGTGGTYIISGYDDIQMPKNAVKYYETR